MLLLSVTVSVEPLMTALVTVVLVKSMISPMARPLICPVKLVGVGLSSFSVPPVPVIVIVCASVLPSSSKAPPLIVAPPEPVTALVMFNEPLDTTIVPLLISEVFVIVSLPLNVRVPPPKSIVPAPE